MASEFFIKGNTIALRRLTLNDVEGNYDYWLNEEEITKYNSHGRFPMSKDIFNLLRSNRNGNEYR